MLNSIPDIVPSIFHSCHHRHFKFKHGTDEISVSDIIIDIILSAEECGVETKMKRNKANYQPPRGATPVGRESTPAEPQNSVVPLVNRELLIFCEFLIMPLHKHTIILLTARRSCLPLSFCLYVKIIFGSGVKCTLAL